MSKPSYVVERRQAQFISLASGCFVWATFYPYLYVVLCLFCLFFYMTERFTLAKCVFLKRSEDVYLHELVSPITWTLKFVYVCKIVVCVLTFVFIEGNG